MCRKREHVTQKQNCVQIYFYQILEPPTAILLKNGFHQSLFPESFEKF